MGNSYYIKGHLVKLRFLKSVPSSVGLVAHWKLWAGPTTINKVFDYSLNGNEGIWQGTELVTNGDFSAWSGVADPDNEPSNWIVNIDGGAVEPTRKLVDATNKCQMITEGNLIQIVQTILTIGKTYSLSINITNVTSNGITVVFGTAASEVSYTSTGTKTGIFTATGTNFIIKRKVAGGAVNVTFTDVSVREVLQGSYPGVLFDGADNKITVPADPTIDANGKTALTIAVWINPASDGGSNVARIVDKTGGIAVGYHFNVRNEASSAVGLRVSLDHDGVADMDVRVDAGVALNVWTHVAFIYNEDSDKKGKLYINGALQSLDTDTAGVGAVTDDSAVDLVIGSRSDGTRTFDGLIDDVMIFNIAKSAAEMKSIYEVNRSRYEV